MEYSKTRKVRSSDRLMKGADLASAETGNQAKRLAFILALSISSAAAYAHNATSASYNLYNAAFDSGGGMSASANFKLNGRLGNAISGWSTSANYRILAGDGPQVVVFPEDAPAGSTTTITGSTTPWGQPSTATVKPGSTWVFAPPGTGPLQTAGFIPLTGNPKSPSTPPPSGLLFPYGLFDFVAVLGMPGTSFTVTIVYPAALPPGAQYWKFGPTPDNARPHWYVLPGVSISGNTATLTIFDGGIGDDDLLPNSIIVDQGGPAIYSPLGAAWNNDWLILRQP